MWYDDVRYQYEVPKVWHSPVYGDGLLTTGDGTEDKKHGYCYQPQVFQESYAGFFTPGSYTRHGWNPDILPPAGRDVEEQFRCGWHPYLARREDAVAWLKDRCLSGQVQRYAHHKPVSERVPYWEFSGFSRVYEWRQYQPWMTAGVTDVVTDEMNVAGTTPLGLVAGFEIHNPDGSHRHVGGNATALKRLWEKLESDFLLMSP